MAGELSETDQRVIACLRKQERSTTEVGKECFRVAGGKTSGTRPAAAHLARMQERGLVTKRGSGYRSYWKLSSTVTDPGPDLFEELKG